MLHLYIGRKKQGYSLSGDSMFNFNFDKSYLLKDFSRRVIKEIDNSEVVSEYCINSPILGGIAPTMISGGAKTLIMLMYTDFRFYLEAMGDNCFPLLKEICDVKDVYLCTTTIRPLFQYGINKFIVENTGELVTDIDRYVDLELLYGGENA